MICLYVATAATPSIRLMTISPWVIHRVSHETQQFAGIDAILAAVGSHAEEAFTCEAYDSRTIQPRLHHLLRANSEEESRSLLRDLLSTRFGDPQRIRRHGEQEQESVRQSLTYSATSLASTSPGPRLVRFGTRVPIFVDARACGFCSQITFGLPPC